MMLSSHALSLTINNRYSIRKRRNLVVLPSVKRLEKNSQIISVRFSRIVLSRVLSSTVLFKVDAWRDQREVSDALLQFEMINLCQAGLAFES